MQQRQRQRKTPEPVHQDARAAFTLRMLMEARGLSAQGLHDAMLTSEKRLDVVPGRSTIDRILSEGAVPQRRHRAAIAHFFDRDTDEIWRVPRSQRVPK